MVETRRIQTNFTSGELSPRLRGRVDLEQYGNGAQEITNFEVLVAGGVTKRPGSYFAAGAANPFGMVVLRRFYVSTVAAYVLEFGYGYVRFYRNRGQVQDATGGVVQLATPYATADLRGLRFAQSVDVLYVFHSNYPTQCISRTGAATFTIAPLALTDGPYDAENTGDVGAPATATVPPSAPDVAAPVAAPVGSGSGAGPAAGLGGAPGGEGSPTGGNDGASSVDVGGSADDSSGEIGGDSAAAEPGGGDPAGGGGGAP